MTKISQKICKNIATQSPTFDKKQKAPLVCIMHFIIKICVKVNVDYDLYQNSNNLNTSQIIH